MIPVTLQMHNFLSYGNEVPPLDFTQFSIACLSGKNGQGKSALLDAITWAIWGEGRKASQEKKADNGLLKIGENQMWVDLTIDLEGERYRIIRKFSRLKNRNHAELTLQVFDEEKSDFISLSSASIRQTQQRINLLLRMDYETFINSAFILQGRVDEFTRKSARERKQILAEVLGLSHYEALSVLAHQHNRELEGNIVILINRIAQITKDIAQKHSIKKDLQLIQNQEKEQGIKIRETTKSLQNLEKRKTQLQFEQDRGKELASRIQAEKKESGDYEKRKSRIEQNIRSSRSVLAKENNILADYEKYQSLYRKNQLMIQLMQHYRNLEKNRRDMEKKIEQEKNHLFLQLEQKKQQYQELNEKVLSISDKRREAQRLKSMVRQLDHLAQQQEKIQTEGIQLNVQIETKNGQIEKIQNEILKSKEKMILLGQEEKDFCPLCHSPLDEQKRDRIRAKFENDIQSCQQEIDSLIEDVKELNGKRMFLQQEWKKIQGELIKRNEIQNALNTVSVLIQEDEKAEQQVKSLEQEIKKLNERIDQEVFAEEERKSLAETESQIIKLGYSDREYVEINRNLELLKDIPLQKERLMEARKSVTNLEKELAELDQQLELKRTSICHILQDLEQVKNKVTELPVLEKMIKSQQEMLDQMQIEQDNLLQQRGVCQEKLAQIDKSEEEQKKLEQEKNIQLHQKEIYEKLTVAFGKNGIQAMIIENAIPDLEEEANSILSKLSDERTSISFESIKELKSGDTRETLDIKIHDQSGIRPYELYSGGETFRIDFAIRVALSKLLTYRAGARLRTLVIDEGFGTQDEDGLEKLIQAIHAIQSDFDKILVITHLSQLKEAFPVRIEVWKDPVLGSQFELIHLS